MSSSLDVQTVTLSLDTNIYADGDVLADRQEIGGVLRGPGAEVKLQSIVLLDKDDQGVAMDLVFLNSDVTLGTENSAVSITDANAESIVGIVNVATGDYFDLVNSQVAVVRDLNLIMEGAGTSTSLYVGAITRGGTPTHTAAGIVLQLGFERLSD